MTLSLLLLAGCPEGGVETIFGAPEVQVTLADGAVIDPKLQGDPALRFVLDVAPFATDTCAASLTVENAVGQSRALDAALEPAGSRLVGTAAWDGRDDAGVPFDVGEWAAVVTTTCGEAQASVEARGWVVRLGVTSVDFDAGADPEAYVPLAFHKADLVTSLVQPIDALTPEYAVAAGVDALDLADGSPRPSLAVWADPDIPPWGAGDPAAVDVNVPTAIVAGAALHATIDGATTTISALTGAAGPVFLQLTPSLLVSGDDGATWSAWVPSLPTAVSLPSVAATLGRTDETLTWRWATGTPDDPTPIPGHQATTHRVYRVLGPPELRDGADLDFAPAVPWVGVLEEVAPAVDGLPPDQDALLDALRDFVHLNEWLIYDPSDSDYSGYSGQYIYWEYSWSELSQWLDRGDGIRLYCHSVSCLLSVLSGHQGVRAPQQVLGVGFTTNLVRAAGTESWSHWGFNSHSVVSPDDGGHIWDASVDVDGDDDPYNQPVEALAPKGMPGDEYFWRLTYDDIDIVNSGLCYFR